MRLRRFWAGGESPRYSVRGSLEKTPFRPWGLFF